ncbi:MAG: hypothetical protein II717_06970 [Lachnospiraceae bacterium]|nr:hypothetical protein [Lachnospiraceae bacterium]
MNSDKKKTNITEIVFRVAGILLLAFYFISLIYLHFNQILYPVTGTFESDLFAHIEMALDGWGYSIIAIILRLLMKLPSPIHFASIAVFLSIFEIASVIVTYMWLKRLKVKESTSVIFSFILGFVMPMFIVWVQPYRYAGYQSPSIWHNSTYIVMKLLALLCLCTYLGISKRYKEELKISSLVLFSILLTLTTAVKSSFILAFAPAALIFLLIDLYFKVPFKRILLCAMTVIPSIAFMIFQKIVLFGSDTGNSIVFDPLYAVYLRTGKPYITMILSAAFPVIVFLFNIVPVIKDTVKDIKGRTILRHRVFLFSWTMWFFSFLMLILLRETGERELDDNFAWGYDFALFALFVISSVYFINTVKKMYGMLDLKQYAMKINAEKKDEENGKKIKRTSRIKTILTILYIEIGCVLLFYHLYCGLYFFVRLLQGATFFMY